LKDIKDKICLSLDVNSFSKAKSLIESCTDYVGVFKVGLLPFLSFGKEILKLSKKINIFLDLKFFDIPSQVKNAVDWLLSFDLYMVNLHLVGGKEMVEEVVDVASKKSRPYIVGVTVLTSNAAPFELLGVKKGVKEIVEDLSVFAKELGLDGVVAPPVFLSSLRRKLGEDFLIVTPSIRPSWYKKKDDQKFSKTPYEAILLGSSLIVVGRPIILAKDPKEAARSVYEEVESALSER